MQVNETEPSDNRPEREGGEPEPGSLENYGEADDGQDYVDRSKIDFDPADGLLSGTAIDGTSDIPDPDEVTSGESADEQDASPSD